MSADDDFSNLILHQRRSLYKLIWKHQKLCLSEHGIRLWVSWKKFSEIWQYLTCMFVDSIRIMSIRENKRRCHMILQSDSMIVNVRTWLFFEVHTSSKLISLHGIRIYRNHEKCVVQLFSQNTKLSISPQGCKIFP